MSDIDDKILEALNDEDKEVMDRYGEELGLFGLIADVITSYSIHYTKLYDTSLWSGSFGL